MNMTRHITFFIENKNEIYYYECDLQNKKNCFTIPLLWMFEQNFLLVESKNQKMNMTNKFQILKYLGS